MKNQDAFTMNRRLVLRGAGGLMLGLPLLETFMPRRAAAQTAVRSPFVLIVVGDNGVPVVQQQAQPAPREHVLAGLRVSASARALTRTGASVRFSGVERTDAPRLATLGLARTAGVS